MNINSFYNYFAQECCLLASPFAEELAYRIPRKIQAKRVLGEYALPICPQCQNTLNREFQRYCDRCGQNLSWNGYGRKTPVEPPPFQGRQLSLFERWR